MQLPKADQWKTDWDGPCPEQEAPDYMARTFADMCRRVEELEDEIAQLRNR